MITLRELLSDYRQRGIAIPAFNIDSFEIFQAVEQAVIETKLPCIVQLSPNEDAFIKAERLLLLVRQSNLHGLPIYLNMDHGKDIPRLITTAGYGWDMIHFDGSFQDFPTNLSTTTYLMSQLKSKNLQTVVEVEFNHISLVDGSIDQSSYTDPLQAKEFMTKTNADLLAVSVGNQHGVSLNNPESLNISLLSQIREAVPSVYFTLHGGSGISADQVESAIKLGIVKININTDLRLAFRQAITHQLTVNHSEKIYEYLTPAIEAVTAVAKQKLIQFGSIHV